MFLHSNTTARARATAGRRLVVVLLAVLVAALAGALHAQTRPVDLGTLGGSVSEAVAVNASGQVVGTSGLYRSFLELCDASTGIDIGPPNRLRAFIVFGDEVPHLRARSVTDVKIPRVRRSRFTLANQSSTWLSYEA